MQKITPFLWFDELLGGEYPEKSQRAMQAMLTMGKIDIAALRQAYDGE